MIDNNEKLEKFDGKKYVGIISLVFIIAIFFGYVSSSLQPDQSEKFIESVFESLSFIDFNNPLEVFMIIFLNNSSKAFIAMVAGFFFGIFPVSFVFLNGYIIGVIIYVKGSELGILRVAVSLLPHGILEIPAVIIASAYGLYLGKLFYLRVFRSRSIDMKLAMKEFIKKFITVIIPILLIAALIETFVTPYLIYRFS
ncbi:Uncharacterized membrane protein [Archaeoglobus sulfaticallidus PM70-1]|uniref:Uncharacterized membrane protein n=1 Tax=Archaeoglobus sulfaticallidus PM70-1 TaxID=387631 RepID=N0BKM7_9EURY|nr:stage II sporulation protein M [Archaeoglobus sulfaticallidus]AGK61061.1 Uncharacterized membrane protein [Archaeoglobus sulfaticallidus PM70-1]